RPGVTARGLYSVVEDAATALPAPGISAIISSPAHGTATVEDGQLIYVPAPDYNGEDELVYRARVGAEVQNVTVALTVTGVNAPPVPLADSYSVDKGGTLAVAAPGVLGNDLDVDTPVLHAVLVGPPHHGQLSLGDDGSFTYIPDRGFEGMDYFAYRADD